MYIILGIIMLLRGFADAIMMRAQQAIAFGGNPRASCPPHHYDQIFTAHGTIMIFFVAMPLVVGLMNFVMPLQIGARDVAFPFLNNFSFWLTAGGAVLVMMSLFVGEFARTGWLAYPPLSGSAYSPGVGVDYYLWALQIAGVGTTLSGINMVATIVKMRAPGMTMMKMPVFTWTALCSNVLIVAIFPVLTACLRAAAARPLRRHQLLHNDLGGNPMMYCEPDLDLGPPGGLRPRPAGLRHLFGSHVDLHRQALFGYTSMVYATVVITILSYLVWLHHFFTMGSGASVNSLLRHHDDDHLDPDRREDLQLAVHDVPREDPLRTADDVDDRLHADLRGRRHDRRAAGGAAGRLRAAQLAVPGRALPQRHHRRRRVRAVRGHHLLVPQGLRLQARRVLGQGRPSGAGSSASGSPSRRSTCSA
jgi:hypothetical protein